MDSPLYFCFHHVQGPGLGSARKTERACAAAPAGLSKSQLETALGSVRGENKTVDSRSSDQQFEALTKYGTDLTAKAAHLDPIIGRDEEVRAG
jgi:ATP-dependent Clp protease ATP-binding subunit ClpB